MISKISNYSCKHIDFCLKKKKVKFRFNLNLILAPELYVYAICKSTNKCLG